MRYCTCFKTGGPIQYLNKCLYVWFNLQGGRLTKLVEDRYASFNSPLGKLIEVIVAPLFTT